MLLATHWAAAKSHIYGKMKRMPPNVLVQDTHPNCPEVKDHVTQHARQHLYSCKGTSFNLRVSDDHFDTFLYPIIINH